MQYFYVNKNGSSQTKVGLEKHESFKVELKSKESNRLNLIF